MSIHKSNRTQRWISVMLLVHLVAMLLPASVVSAAAQADACGGASLQSAQVSAAGVHAADEQVVIPKELVDRAAYQANWRFAYKDAEAINELIYNELIINISRETPGNEYEKIMDEFQQTYAKAIVDRYGSPAGRTADELVHTALDIALKMPNLQGAVPRVVQFLRAPGAGVNNNPLYHSIAGGAQRYGLGERLQQNLAEVLQRTYDCAKSNPAVKKVLDKRHSGPTKSKIDDSARQIATQNPENPALQDILQRVGENGTISLSLNQLNAMSRAEFGKINTALDDIQKTLVVIDRQQDDLLQYMSNQEAREVARALAAAKAAEYELTIKALQSSISIITTLTGFIAPAHAKQVSTILNSALMITDSMTKWLDAVAGLNGLNKLTSLSTVVMTGNVLGAVMNVVNLFGGAQPTPDQMILEEIGKLRQQVNQLRTEMHDRFDRIDQELNVIYSTMQDRFDLIDIQLGKINGNIQEVQKSLVALDLKLSRIERNNFEFLDALGRRPLLEAINGGLGYQRRTGEPMPYQPQFVEFENVLHGWGTLHAFDALAAGPTQRDYSAGALLTELNAFPVDANLNYLNGWLSANGYPALSNKRLASPRDWLFATRAYAQLGLDWPAHMRRIDPQRHAQLNAISVDLEAAMRNIAAINTLTNTQGNTLLFSNVITHYQGKLDQVDVGIQALEAAYLAEIRASLQQTQTFDLYGGIDQALTYKAPGLDRMSQDPEQTLPAPHNLAANITNFNRYNLAEYLTISNTAHLKVSFTGFLENARQVPGCRPDPDVCAMMGDLSVFVGVGYGKVALLWMELKAGRVILPVIASNVEEPIDYIARNWNNLKARFEAEASIVAPSPAESTQRADLLREITRQLEERLAAYQHGLYSRVLNELNNGSLRASATEVAGGKALLESFVTLGLPRALDNDDFLRAMLFGNQRLLDNNQIMHSYAISATQPITGANLLVNPRLAIGQVADRRTVAFSGLINQYLTAITAKTYTEAPDYITNARQELALTMRIAQLDPQSAPTPNQVPVATDDAAATLVDSALAINLADLLANDSDADGDPLSVTEVSTPSEQGGAVVLDSNTIRYTPPAGFVGVDRFAYTISDGRNGTATGRITVTVSQASSGVETQIYLPLIER